MEPLYFLHIPKCGGTSIRKRIRERFGDGLCPALVWDDFYRHPEWRERRYQAYCGHFGMDLSDFLGTPLRTFALLRDPVPRTVSHYFEVRRSKGHYWSRKVRGQSLQEYLEDPDTMPLTWNLQARYLFRTPLPVEFMARAFPPDRTYNLMRHWESACCCVSPPDLLRGARVGLEALDFVATTETMAASFPEMARRYGLPGELPHENKGGHQGVEAGDETVQRIRDLTEIDRDLVDSVSVRRAQHDRLLGAEELR